MYEHGNDYFVLVFTKCFTILMRGERMEQQSSLPKDERMWGMLCHLSALLSFVLPVAGGLIGPLIVYLLKKEEYPFVNDQGKESINFQISIMIYAFISFILTLVVIGILLAIAVGIFWLVCVIIGAIKANEGISYRYPLTIRFFK